MARGGYSGGKKPLGGVPPVPALWAAKAAVAAAGKTGRPVDPRVAALAAAPPFETKGEPVAKAGNITVKVTPEFDAAQIHQDLVEIVRVASRDVVRHVVARVLRRKCPVCG